jgi:hypothetical protein
MKRLFAILILLLLTTSLAHAQATTSPLLDMLALVPDTSQVRAGITLASYADYRQFEAARGIQTPTAADFDGKSDAVALWRAATNGLFSGPEMNYFFQQLGDPSKSGGFSPLEVERALVFGDPPAMGTIRAGTFDTAKIDAALTGEGWQKTTVAAATTAWCNPDGCDQGKKLDLKSRNPANPFGGPLGRKDVVAALPGYLVSSPVNTVVEGMVKAANKQTPSLADDAYVQAAVSAMMATGSIRQAQFYNPLAVSQVSLPNLERLSREQVDKLKKQLQPDSSAALPQYTLMFMADTWKDKDQFAMIGLVYSSAEVAKQAAGVLDARLKDWTSLQARRPFVEMIQEQGGDIQPAYVAKDAATGKATVMLVVRYPMPDNERHDDNGRSAFTASSLIFRLFAQALYARDLMLVATSIS